MAITFTKLTVRNFMSYGDEDTTVSLNSHQSTVVSATNGGGKSSLLLDGITFALFGKAHRDVNKGHLINSINKKDCVVSIEFVIGKNTFKVVRGLKPNIFEIYKNDKIIDQAAAVRDYQKYLETNILKLNFKSFNQVVILGSSSYVPFMQLPTYQRRQVIEDLLDIDIFSKMNQILKEHIAISKSKMGDIENKLDIVKEKISMQQKHINAIENLAEEQITLKETQINEWIEEAENANNEINSLMEDVNSNYDDLVSNKNEKTAFRNKLKDDIAKVKNHSNSLVKETKFYVENDVCPSCSQPIDSHLKDEKVEHAKQQATDLSKALSAYNEDLRQTEANLNAIEEALETIRNKQTVISNKQSEVGVINNNITKTRKLIAELKANDKTKLANLKTEMDDLVNERNVYSKEKTELNEQKRYTDIAYDLLKDTGIKTKVVQEYLPVMNKMIAKYLDIMDFFVSFSLDENFEEIIRSRHRDHFKYSSFSEGEKCKINLALMLTWRAIARLKNSASTNLLILDEIGDSSLDATASEAYVKILTTLENTNVFVISHKLSQQVEKFDNVIEIEKQGNFSRIK